MGLEEGGRCAPNRAVSGGGGRLGGARRRAAASSPARGPRTRRDGQGHFSAVEVLSTPLAPLEILSSDLMLSCKVPREARPGCEEQHESSASSQQLP